MLLTIDKAKLVKGGEKVEISFTKQADNGTKSSGGELFNAPIHPDLKKAFDALIIHFAIMTGQLPLKSVKDITNFKDELIEGFKVSGISIGGDNEGITLTGTRLLWNGKAFNSNTPYYKFEESDQTRYTHMDDLIERLDRVKDELIKYMDGKRGADGQLDLFESDKEKVTKMQIAEPDKPVFKTDAQKDTDGLHDVTEEYMEINKNRQETKLKIPPADPEAMARVKAGDIEDAEIISETPNPPKPKGSRKKKVAQSADAPGGEMEEPAE